MLRRVELFVRRRTSLLLVQLYGEDFDDQFDALNERRRQAADSEATGDDDFGFHDNDEF